MWEHIHRLNAAHLVHFGHQLYVACLRCRIAAHVYYLAWSHREKLLYHPFVHAGTRWVGYHHIRSSVFAHKLVGEDLCHIACVEFGIAEIVQYGVDLGVVYSLFHILDADHTTAHPRDKLCDGARARIQVVDGVVGLQLGKLRNKRIQALGLR